MVSIPTKTEGSIGRVKADNVPPGVVPDSKYFTSAAQLERIKDHLIEVCTVVDGIVDGIEGGSSTPEITSWHDDLDEIGASAGRWNGLVDVGGSIGIAPSASALPLGTPFPSRGVVALAVGADGSAALIAPTSGLCHSATQPIVLTWRTSVPLDESTFATVTDRCDARWGIAGAFGESGPTLAVILQASADGSWALGVVDGDPDAPTIETVTMPACDWFELRITASSAGITLEVAPNGGAFATLLESSTPAPDGVYVPFASVEPGDGAGSAQVLLDSVTARATRATAHAGVAVEGGKFPVPLERGQTADMQAVSTFNNNGSIAAYAPIDHQHAVDTAVIATRAHVAAVEVLAVSADTTLASTDPRIIHVDDTAERIDLTLPDPASRRAFTVKKIAGNTNGIRLVRHGSEKIETAAASYDLPGSTTAYSTSSPLAWLVYSDGTDWFVA